MFGNDAVLEQYVIMWKGNGCCTQGIGSITKYSASPYCITFSAMHVHCLGISVPISCIGNGFYNINIHKITCNLQSTKISWNEYFLNFSIYSYYFSPLVWFWKHFYISILHFNTTLYYKCCNIQMFRMQIPLTTGNYNEKHNSHAIYTDYNSWHAFIIWY